MPKNYYDHNVDIRSSQLGNAAKDAKKFVAESITGAFILIGISIVVLTVWNYSHNEESKRLAANAPRLNYSQAANDYVKNPMRYKSNWGDKYVAYSGQIKSIGSYSLEFDGGFIRTPNGNGESTKIRCNLRSGQRDKAASLNSGNYATVTGKLYTSYSAWNTGEWIFSLENCRLK